MLAGLVYIVGGLVELIIGLRVLLRLIGANPNEGLVAWIYDVSTPLVTPFAGIFGQEASVVSETGAVVSSVFDWTAMIAIIVYAVLIAILARGIARIES